MRLAITYNVRKSIEDASLPEDIYAEWDDIGTIEAVRSALLKRHKEVFLVEANEDFYDKLREIRPEFVFNMAEGLKGEARESHVPAILEFLGIPYTGSSPLTLALCLNKARTKQILSCENIPTAKYFIAGDRDVPLRSSMDFPLMVKPLYEGSSKGIRNDSIVYDADALRAKAGEILDNYHEPAIVEEFLPGREFTVAILGNGRNLRVLPIVEINYSSLPSGVNPIYSYEAKWIFDRPESPLDIFVCPAPIDDVLKKEITDVATRSFNALDVRDWCRIDIRLDSEGAPNVLELNPLPGILPHPEQNSCFPKASRAAGIEFDELINRVIDLARERYCI